MTFDQMQKYTLYAQKERMLRRTTSVIFLCLCVALSLHYYQAFINICIFNRQLLYKRQQQQQQQKCFKNRFENTLLIIIFNFGLYDHIPLLKKLYQTTFPNIVFCGPTISHNFSIVTADIYNGYFSYHCLPMIMRNYANYDNYSGYLFMNDDVLLNFWNLPRLDANEIWEGPKKPISVSTFHRPDHWWYWWGSRWGLKNCIKTLNITRVSGKNHGAEFFKTLRKNNKNSHEQCYGGRSDVFYIPRRFLHQFVYLAKMFRNNDVFLEIAVPTILRMLDNQRKFQHLKGVYLPGRAGTEPVVNSNYLWSVYNADLDFIHPVKLHYGENSTNNYLILENFIQQKVNKLVHC